MNEKEYSVSEAVRRTGVPSHVLRYWEEELQIMIHRSAQGYRIYTESDLELFRRVKLLKEKGIQLKAIRVLLEEPEENKQGNEETVISESGYEIILGKQIPDQMAQFKTIIKTMLAEVVEEQNEKLEQSLKECLREELEVWYMKHYDELCQEAAAAAEPEKKSLWDWIFRR